jgi:hypothetical protein
MEISENLDGLFPVPALRAVFVLGFAADTFSSTKVFHSWQDGHCPIHLALSYPQF